MDHTTDLDFSWECGREGHQHPSWDGAELCATKSDPQVEQLQKAVTKLTLSCMRALDALKLLLPPDHEKVKQELVQAGTTQFGSGWAWLVVKDGKIAVAKTGNAENPLLKGLRRF